MSGQHDIPTPGDEVEYTERVAYEERILEAEMEAIRFKRLAGYQVEQPFAYCCAEGGGRIEGCGCVNKDHGTAWFDVVPSPPIDPALFAEMVAALRDLEQANDGVAAQRSVRTYHSIVQDGASELLLVLDEARSAARAILAKVTPS